MNFTTDGDATALDALRVINEVARILNGSGEQELQAVDRAMNETLCVISS